MPSIALLAPVLLPLVAAGVITAFGLTGFNAGPLVVSAGAWAALIALMAIWLSVRSTQELNLGPLGFGSRLDLRVDAVAFAFGLMVLVPAALLLTLQRRTWQEATLGLLGVASAMGAIEAGAVILTALAAGTAATLAVVPLDTEDGRAPLRWVTVDIRTLRSTRCWRRLGSWSHSAPRFALRPLPPDVNFSARSSQASVGSR